MAIQSFYFSIEIPEEEKKAVRSASEADFKRYKKDSSANHDLVYKNALFIANVAGEEGYWWHIKVGLYDFFHQCEVLYALCRAIENLKPNFAFRFLGKNYEFKFQSLMEFVSFIYPRVEDYKKYFEEEFGVLSVYSEEFFTYWRKNKRYFK